MNAKAICSRTRCVNDKLDGSIYIDNRFLILNQARK